MCVHVYRYVWGVGAVCIRGHMCDGGVCRLTWCVTVYAYTHVHTRVRLRAAGTLVCVS